MERSEFRDIMFQYKKAKELDPQLKYWDWKADKYEKGSDGIKATPEQKKQINEHMQKMHRMSGAISPVVNLQDAADFTPIGTAGAGLYIGNKEDNSYSEGTQFVQPKRFNPSDYATDNIPSKANVDKALIHSEQLQPNYKRYEINYDNLSPTDAVYEDVRLYDNTKPRFELRKGNDIPTYYSDKYMKYIRSMGKVLKIFGPVFDFIQYAFPTEQQEKIYENYFTDYSKRKKLRSLKNKSN